MCQKPGFFNGKKGVGDSGPPKCDRGEEEFIQGKFHSSTLHPTPYTPYPVFGQGKLQV